MKDTIKNSIIGAFALFGLLAIISGNTTQQTTQEPTCGTPESHIWSMVNVGGRAYSINAKTGAVRHYAKTITATEETNGLKEYKAKAMEYGQKR